MIDHDRLFKELLTTCFQDFIELFAPDLAARVEWDSLRFLDKEIFTDVTEGERHEADLIAVARVRGEESCFLIHVENQASKQSEFAERMFHYFARLRSKHRLPIYPIVLFSYDKPRKAEPDFFRVELAGLQVLDFRFHAIQLNRLSWRDYVKHANPVASALMAKMQIAPHERAKVKLECLRLLVTLKLNPARMQMIAGFVDTYLELNREEFQEFNRELAREQPAQREKVVEITGNWARENWHKGQQEGRQEGRRQEASTLILRQLTRRVGPLTKRLESRVQKLPLEKAEALAEALLDFSTRADLEAWLQANAKTVVETK